MNSLKIVTSVFLKATIDAFPQLFKDIGDAITSNATIFTVIPYTQVQLQAYWVAMTDTTTAARDGSKASRDARDLQRIVCNNVLLALSTAVLTRAFQASSTVEAENIVNLSKFTLAKTEHEPTPPLPQVAGVKGAWTGNPGEAVIEWNRIPDAASYNIFKAMSDPSAPNVTWEFVGSVTRKKFTITNLPSLARVWVHVVAVGKDNEVSVPSYPAMITIG